VASSGIPLKTTGRVASVQLPLMEAATPAPLAAWAEGIDERLKRLAELFELGDLTKTDNVARTSDLRIERDQLETQPAAASIALQRQQLQSVVDDWSLMTDEEKKRVLKLIFSEIRTDHTVDGLKIESRPKPVWEPYVEAVLARQRQEQGHPGACYHFGAEDGGQARGSDNNSARSGRAWVAPAGRLNAVV
jgi:hypothetical protein